jgi:methylenetetrahydrofolate reductase (NADPH)
VRAPVLVSIFIPRSARNLAWLRDNVAGVAVPEAVVERVASRPEGDQAAEGRRLAMDLIAAVRHVPGVAGVHLISLGDVDAAAAVAIAARG